MSFTYVWYVIFADSIIIMSMYVQTGVFKQWNGHWNSGLTANDSRHRAPFREIK